MHSNGNHKQNEKTTLGMRENIYKQSNQQGINLQIIQTAMQLNIKKTNKHNQKMNSKWIRDLNKDIKL